MVEQDELVTPGIIPDFAPNAGLVLLSQLIGHKEWQKSHPETRNHLGGSDALPCSLFQHPSKF